jgi:hypothetical protein
MLVAILPFNQNFNQNYMIFICGVISTHANHICILVLTTLKFTTSGQTMMVETM